MRDLDGAGRTSNERKHGNRGRAEPAGEAMILVMHRPGMMMVVRVGARLIRRMGKDPPTGFFCGAGLARPSAAIEKRVKQWRHDQGEIEHQEERCSVSYGGRSAGLKNSTTHVTKPASDPTPLSDSQESGCPAERSPETRPPNTTYAGPSQATGSIAVPVIFEGPATVESISTVLFFLLGILDISDLEDIPWNIVLLFGGAMSIGLCLYETEAARWLAVHWLTMFQEAHWFVFVIGMAFFVMAMTNFIMNVAAIAISLPVALVMAPYLGVSPEVIIFASLVVAGMPFLLLVGAAPNAIAYNSKQFTSGEFFKFGVPASLMLMVVVAVAVLVIWPLLGMSVTMGN